MWSADVNRAHRPTTPTRAEDTGNQRPEGAWSACKGEPDRRMPPRLARNRLFGFLGS